MSWTTRPDDNDPATLRAEIDALRAQVDEKSDVGHAVADAWQARAERAENAYREQLEGTRLVDDLRMREIKELNTALARVREAWEYSGSCYECDFREEIKQALEGGDES